MMSEASGEAYTSVNIVKIPKADKNFCCWGRRRAKSKRDMNEKRRTDRDEGIWRDDGAIRGGYDGNLPGTRAWQRCWIKAIWKGRNDMP
ncbi:hypothetical protein OESDEN_00614 [Oesophagostomum dentatum]|uniref:Uncharacterized protein n=1 Tax=Oesophagostomum dentatum TaxID=61180 RepID=A0A0B1TTA7_OESDE|nr:hypothetical protein OESDEN_00614 [Oesophagostomum dentatum]